SSSARATRSRAAASETPSVAEDGLAVPADLVLRHLAEPRAGDGGHGGEDAPVEVRAAGAQVLVRGVHDGLDGHPEGLVLLQVAAEALLQRVARVLASRALGEVVGLLVAAARHVVLEEPPDAGALVEAREDRHHPQP